MTLEELHNRIVEISLGDKPHSLANSQFLDTLFADKRKLLNEIEYGLVKTPKLNCGHNKYE